MIYMNERKINLDAAMALAKARGILQALRDGIAELEPIRETRKELLASFVTEILAEIDTAKTRLAQLREFPECQYIQTVCPFKGDAK